MLQGDARDLTGSTLELGVNAAYQVLGLSRMMAESWLTATESQPFRVAIS